MKTTREEITEKYLIMALQELSKHRGSIKKGRAIDQAWHKEMLNYELVWKYRETDNKETGKTVIKLNKGGK